jgi:hypothetical protein
VQNFVRIPTGKVALDRVEGALDGIDTRIGLCLLNDRVLLQAYLAELSAKVSRACTKGLSTS